MERRLAHDDDEERRHLGPSEIVVHRGSDDDGDGDGRSISNPQPWPTIDGPLGLSADEQSVAYARNFFLWGFALLPFLWAVNCCYFWPVLKSSPSAATPVFARIRPYVLRSAIGFLIFTGLLTAWILTFMIGGERLFGPTWNDLVIYNLADKLGLTGFM